MELVFKIQVKTPDKQQLFAQPCCTPGSGAPSSHHAEQPSVTTTEMGDGLSQVSLHTARRQARKRAAAQMSLTLRPPGCHSLSSAGHYYLFNPLTSWDAVTGLQVDRFSPYLDCRGSSITIGTYLIQTLVGRRRSG